MLHLFPPKYFFVIKCTIKCPPTPLKHLGARGLVHIHLQYSIKVRLRDKSISFD